MLDLSSILSNFSKDELFDLYIDIGNHLNVPGRTKVLKNKDLNHIQSLIEGVMCVSIFEKTRKQDYVVGRQLFYYIIFKSGRYDNITQIGQRFNVKDHATIMHSVKAIENYRTLCKSI